MKIIHRFLALSFLGFLLFLTNGCSKGTSPVENSILFDTIPIQKPLRPLVNEISGIADSKRNDGLIWAEEDSGNPPQLYLVNREGAVIKTIYINGVTNRDWEDLALSGSTIYVAETGDNRLAYSDYAFYTFPEPAQATDTVRDVSIIHFRYPDGSHNAEAFLIDSASGNIYVITKQDNPSRIYKLSPPFSSMNTAALCGTLPYTEVVSAAISSNGSEILVKTYDHLNYYKRAAGESLLQCLQHAFVKLALQAEPQGEAVCFAQDNTGFFTLSEKGFASFVNLNFYKRR